MKLGRHHRILDRLVAGHRRLIVALFVRRESLIAQERPVGGHNGLLGLAAGGTYKHLLSLLIEVLGEDTSCLLRI